MASNYYIDIDWHATINQLNGNLDGMQIHTSLGRYGIITDPYIPKTINDVLDFTTRHTWTRATI